MRIIERKKYIFHLKIRKSQLIKCMELIPKKAIQTCIVHIQQKLASFCQS